MTLDDTTSAAPSFTAPEQLANDRDLIFTLEVTDARGMASAPATVVITVTAGPNDAPTANAGNPQTVDEAELVTLNGADSSDPEGEDLDFAWIAPDGVTLDDATSATPRFTAPVQLVDDLELIFTLEVTDARSLASESDTVVITVTAGPNDAPIANAGVPQTVDEGELVTLAGAGSDPESETLTFAWIAPDGVTLDDVTSAAPSFTAPEQLANDRDLIFTLEVTDARGMASAPATVTITVTAGPNDAPTANAGDPQTVDEAELVTLDGAGSSDPEGEDLDFAWIAPDGVTLDDVTSATPRFTAPEQLVDDLELEFTLEVTDARSLASAPATVVITVTAGSNDAPTANAGNPQTVDEAELVTLNGAGSSDPESENLTFAWTAPDGVTLDDATSATPGFTAPEQLVDDLELEFTLVVTDARSLASAEPATVTITVTAGPNDAPIANAGNPQTVDEGELVTLAGAGSDPESEMLTFAWTAPDGVTLDDVTSAAPTFTAPVQLVDDLELEFTLEVTDARGLTSAPATVVITVTAGPNDAPSANAGDPQTVDEAEVVTLAGAGSDPESEMLSFAWTAPDGVTLDDTTSAAPSFTAPEQLANDRDLIFTLEVTDARGMASAPATVTITVTAGPNDAPTANAGNPQTVDEAELVTLNGADSSDPEGEDLDFAWIAPDGVTLDDATSATPSFTAPEQLVDDLELEFTLKVTDARSLASESATVVITVTAGPNDAPIANAGDPQTVDEAEVVTLAGAGSDPESETLTFAWIAPDGVTLDDVTSATPRFTAPVQLVDDLELEFTLEVTDARGLASAPATVVIMVTAGPNDPPTADAGVPQTVDEGELVTLDGAGSSDPEGEDLDFAWIAPDGVTLDDAASATPGFTAPSQLVADRALRVHPLGHRCPQPGNLESRIR